jgi:hypothetical protein
MNLDSIPGAQTTVELLRAVSKTANVNGTGVQIRDYVGSVKIIQSSGAITSGDDNSTYTFTIQHSNESGANYTNVTTYSDDLTAANNVGGVVVVDIPTRLLKDYVRVVGNIAGANSPAFPVTVLLSGIKQVG